ncbi:MarR family transcriptional regulator [Herbihabitans rhizosphaerae]|uniref:MarR family transcriptional regulator n=1 Tax=Herbihabitans rhizosphaerae TaxID=1872711 RepID=A0A4V2ETE3_9PSEU|nr:MarR family transcriptional regulator [Herbihabitans rhizosphaerae]RZS40773.1 MarR family transcriptional regulator [Herbihabitans rhizosphaerae]
MTTEAQAAPPATQVSTDLCFLLSQASHVLTTELAAALETVGISPRARCVLTNANRGEFTQSQLAEMSALDKTTMTATIDELEQNGYAERKASATDRRARIIAVTKTGKRILAMSDDVVADVYADVLEALPDGQAELFLEMLAHLVGKRLAQPAHCQQQVRRPRQSH